MMILGRAQHHEQLCAIKVRTTELPEGAPDGVDHPRGHVDRAKAAVRGVVRRAELPGEQAGESLHLVASREQRKTPRVGGAYFRKAIFEDPKRIIPRDRLEVGRAALTAGFSPERPRQACRRVLFHRAGGALGADHTPVDWMIRIAVDIADRAILDRHADSAAASAHIAGGVLDFGVSGVVRYSGGLHRTPEVSLNLSVISQSRPCIGCTVVEWRDEGYTLPSCITRTGPDEFCRGAKPLTRVIEYRRGPGAFLNCRRHARRHLKVVLHGQIGGPTRCWYFQYARIVHRRRIMELRVLPFGG